MRRGAIEMAVRVPGNEELLEAKERFHTKVLGENMYFL